MVNRHPGLISICKASESIVCIPVRSHLEECQSVIKDILEASVIKMVVHSNKIISSAKLSGYLDVHLSIPRLARVHHTGKIWPCIGVVCADSTELVIWLELILLRSSIYEKTCTTNIASPNPFTRCIYQKRPYIINMCSALC